LLAALNASHLPNLSKSRNPSESKLAHSFPAITAFSALAALKNG
jgi:hypothetical protein